MCAVGVTTVIVFSSCRPTSQPIQPGRRDLDGDGQALARPEPDARPDGLPAQYDRHRLAVAPLHRNVLDVAREARQRNAREAAARRSDADARPGQQRRPCGDRDRQADAQRSQEPPSQHDDFSMAYAPNEMARPDAGRGVPRELSSGEIEEFLRSQRIARLGCHAGGSTYVVPLIYAYDDGAVVAVTTEGRKTAMLRENPRVCVEVDEYDTDGKGSWRSVIAHGSVRGARRRRRRAGAGPHARALRAHFRPCRRAAPARAERRRPADQPHRNVGPRRRAVIFPRKQGMRLCTEIEKHRGLGMDFGATPFYNSYGWRHRSGGSRVKPPGRRNPAAHHDRKEQH